MHVGADAPGAAGGSFRGEPGFGDLSDLAAEADELVEVGRDRAVEVGAAGAGDLVRVQIPAGAVLAVLAPDGLDGQSCAVAPDCASSRQSSCKPGL